MSILVVLAAGLSTRYGRLKQLDALGPRGETLCDYALRDALAAGYRRAVLVTRAETAEAFARGVAARWQGRLEVRAAVQDDAPRRPRPWGTTHALLSAAPLLDAPFSSVNADDYYGPAAYRAAAHALKRLRPGDAAARVLGHRLADTMPPSGGVTRAVLETGPGGALRSVREVYRVGPDGRGGYEGRDAHGRPVALEARARVSMNFWSMTLPALALLSGCFERFVRARAGSPEAELPIPEAVAACLGRGLSCAVDRAEGRWLGVTHPEDREWARRELCALDRTEAMAL